MTYKEIKSFLESAGFEKIDEGHGDLIPHWFKYGLSNGWGYSKTVEIVCASSKDSSPSKIIKYTWEA